MMKLEDLYVSKIVCGSMKGTTLDRCMVEAAKLALEENNIVVFYFNDKAYAADPVLLKDAVIEGETAKVR